MIFGKRDLSWEHPKLTETAIVTDKDGNESEQTVAIKRNFSIEYQIPQTEEDRIKLCGTEDRINTIIGQRISTYPNTKKASFDEATTIDEINQAIEKIIAGSKEYDLTSTRGDSEAAVNKAKAADYDKLQSVLTNPDSTPEQRLAALRDMGYGV